MKFLIDLLVALFEKYGIFGIFLGMMLESMGVPGAGAALDLLAGPLHKESSYSIPAITLTATAGLTVGSAISYFIGRLISRNAISYLKKRNKEELITKLKSMAEKNLKIGIFLAQLYGTTRTFISFPAGILKLNFLSFIVFTALGGLVYCFLITLASTLAYSYMKEIYLTYSRFAHFQVAVGAVIVLSVFFLLIRRRRKKKTKSQAP